MYKYLVTIEVLSTSPDGNHVMGEVLDAIQKNTSKDFKFLPAGVDREEVAEN